MSSDRASKGGFLGSGWSFPPEFLPRHGVTLSQDEEDIRGSLNVLLRTAPGERLFHPSYGLDLRSMLFEPMSTTELTLLEDRVRTAILIYEPRIDVLALTVDGSELLEGVVQVSLDYVIRATNSRFNLVFPFYLGDGSELSSPMELR